MLQTPMEPISFRDPWAHRISRHPGFAGQSPISHQWLDLGFVARASGQGPDALTKKERTIVHGTVQPGRHRSGPRDGRRAEDHHPAASFLPCFLVPSFCFPFYSRQLETKGPLRRHHTGPSILVPRLGESSSGWAEQGLEAVLLSTLHKDKGSRPFLLLLFIINNLSAKLQSSSRTNSWSHLIASYYRHSCLAQPSANLSLVSAFNMPSGNKNSTKMSNGMGSGLSAGNLNNVPDESRNNVVNRFSQVSAAEEPYFARARMQDRSEHVSRLSSQLDATEAILKK